MRLGAIGTGQNICGTSNLYTIPCYESGVTAHMPKYLAVFFFSVLLRRPPRAVWCLHRCSRRPLVSGTGQD